MVENKTIAYQNLWNVAKTVLSGKFRAISAYIKKGEKSQVNLTFYFKKLGKDPTKANKGKKQ